MLAMRLHRPGEPLRLERLPIPCAGPGQIQLRVEACGVCRTDVHLIDGELPHPVLPIIPGHEIVGRISALGVGVSGFYIGQQVGVPWLGWTCGACRFCLSGRENLCDAARFTGYQIDGGYAEYTVADARYCFPLNPASAGMTALELAPLLCAGLIGGLGSAVAEILAETTFPSQRLFRRLGLPDTFCESYGSQASLMAKQGLSATTVAEQALALVQRTIV